jgi:pyruvate kinase
MKVIASTRPNRPILHNVDCIRLNGAFVTQKELLEIRDLYSVPMFFDIPTKRNKVKVSDISLEFITATLTGQDIIAISKVEDVQELPETKCRLCAKVESLVGVERLDTFIKQVDMVCIDRADLISEVGIDSYFILETQIIRVAKAYGKEVAIASEVLPSLLHSKTVTIPEIIQLYYYKSRQVDYLVLAEETAVGFYPYQAIDTIKRIGRGI